MQTDNNDDVIELHYQLKRLHQELAGLYRMKSHDKPRIDMLWREIEKREHVLDILEIEYK
jgi:hypothetical protein